MSRSYAFTGHCSHGVANDVIHNPYTLRAMTGVMVDHCLGCGANGCAFRVEDSLVLKVSAHDGEAPIAEILKGHGRIWPFLPIFHGAWIIRGRSMGRRNDVGVTLREDLIDFSPEHPKDFMDAATRFLDEASRSRSTRKTVELRRDLERMTTTDGQALKALADFAVWSSHYDLGFDLREFSGGLAITNLGQTLDCGSVVIRDLGNFEPAKRALEGLRRATLHRVRDQRAVTR